MDNTRTKTVKRIYNPQIATCRKRRVAAYCRVSVDFEMNVHSLNTQVDYYSKLITSNPAW